jgi:cytochrome c oxidase subunit III
MTHAAKGDSIGARLGMWLFLFTELLLFGGLFILYAVYLHRYPQEFTSGGKELNVYFGTANTVVLLTSSLFAAMAVTAVQQGKKRQVLGLLGGTLLCALVFLINKYLEWSAKIGHGIWPGSPRLIAGAPGESVFFSLYYVTTGLHALHVAVGSAIVAWISIRVKSGATHSGSYVALENGTLYWHLVDLVWIFIFPLYYLIL